MEEKSNNLEMNKEEPDLGLTLPTTSFTNQSSHDFIETEFSPVIPASKGVPLEATLPPSPPPPAEAETVLDPAGGLYSWVKQSVGSVSVRQHLTDLAERAKSSVDSVITTLDPQMKEYINSGGDVEVLVTSDNEDEVSPIREAFQDAFGKATVIGLQCKPSDKVAVQPLGFAAGLTSAKDKITQLQSQGHHAHNKTPIVGVEDFILEVIADRWFQLSVLVLSDSVRGVNLEVFTQMTPIPLAVVVTIREETKQDYPHRESGFSTSIAHYMSTNLNVSLNSWHEKVCGVSKRQLISMAAKSLATSYKNAIS